MNGNRIIIGAGDQRYDGWVATQREDLDLTRDGGWPAPDSVDAFLCEHVWEHLSEAEGRAAAARCYRALRPGGYLRVAVPDGYFPDAAYQAMVQVGGPGPVDHPAADHKVVYTHDVFADVFTGAGFDVTLLEYCDAEGRFHHRDWDPTDGPIYRSLRSDHRNQGGQLGFVSLILDAVKPLV